MELLTARLRIDALQERDADVLFAYRADPDVARYQGWRPQTRVEAIDFVRAQQQASFDRRGGWVQRAIRLLENGPLIGDLGLHVPAETDGSYEFGITVAPSYQGQGYAHEAARALLDAVFHRMGAHRVQASIDPRNTASAALLRSLGMRQEAHFKESLRLHGEWVDDVVFALLAREWS